MKSVKLYHFPLTRSVRASWTLYEMGVDFELVKVNVIEGEHYSKWFTAMNPNHGVPVLEFDDVHGTRTTVYESGAIVAFLANFSATPLHKGPVLVPAAEDVVAQASYKQWLWFAGAWMDMMLWSIRLHRDLLPPSERDSRVVQRNKKKFQLEVEPQLISQLERTGAWIVGPQFTAADCVVGHCLRWSAAYGLARHGLLQAYLKRCAQRPAFQKAYADASDFPSHEQHERFSLAYSVTGPSGTQQSRL